MAADGGDAGRRTATIRLASGLVLALLAAGVLAMIVTASTTSSGGVAFVPGSDAHCSASPVYPCAAVSVDGTGTIATMGISFPPSTTASPQPAVYYTDLLEVHNEGSVNNTVVSLNVTSVTGASYLGKITIYYCTARTDDPAGSPRCASFSITDSSGGALSGNGVIPSILTPGSTAYVEVVAFASATSTVSDVVSFVLKLSASYVPATTQQGAPPPAGGSSSSSSTTSTTSSTLTSASSARQVTVTLTATQTATTTSTAVLTSTMTTVTTATASTTVQSTATSTATTTSTTVQTSVRTETTGPSTVTTTVAQSGQSPWALLLVVILLAILLYLVARWLRSRKGKPGVKLFWQR